MSFGLGKLGSGFGGMGGRFTPGYTIQNMVFQAPLTHTLNASFGGYTGTFTRDSSQTVEDYEGILRTVTNTGYRGVVGADVPAFKGARLVRNELLQSGAIEDASWTKRGGVVATDNFALGPSGLMNATRIQGMKAGTNDFFQAGRISGLGPLGGAVIPSFWLKIITKPPSNETQTIECRNPNNANQGTLRIDLDVLDLDTWYHISPGHFSVTVVSAFTGDINGLCGWLLRGAAGGQDTAGEYYIAEPQLENASGASDTTTPSEYQATTTVPHSRWYDTDRNGDKISLSTLEFIQIWEARTNICLQSEDFETTWANAGANTTFTTGETGPDGASSATDILHGDTDEDLTQNITVTADTVYTFSVFIKSGATGTHDWVLLRYKDAAAANGIEAWFDLTSAAAVGTSQTFGTGTTLSGTQVETIGSSGWYRVSISGQLATGITAGQVVLENVTADAGTTSEATNSVRYFGAQLEAGAFPSPYIKTTTSSVTRSACVLDFGDDTVIEDAAGMVYCEFIPGYTGNVSGDDDLVTIRSSSSVLTKRGSNGNTDAFDGTTVATVSASPVKDTLGKHSCRWATSGTHQIIADGTAGTAQSYDGSWPRTASTLLIGGGSTTRVPNGGIGNVRIWNEDKGQTFLEALTT